MMRKGIWLAVLLAGCAQLPPRATPAVSPAPAFKEAQAGAEAATVAGRTISPAWWHIYGDAELDALQDRLLASSPDLASALARYQQARAATDVLRAERTPHLGAGAAFERGRTAAGEGAESRAANRASLGFDLEYEVDLWGRIRQQVNAGEAEERAAGADLAAARLSLQAQLSDTVLALRGADADIALLRDTDLAYTRAAALVAERHRLGMASGLDAARADTQAEAARSQLRQLQGQRAVLEHAIASLAGIDPSTFTIAETPAAQATLRSAAVPVPTGVPSQLLQRRPDIVAARERVAAASASSGAARTAFFPSLTLSASGGVQSAQLSRLLAMPGRYWALGPALALELLDGGRREALVTSADARLDEAGQRYRGTVLSAIQQVEDQLALLSSQDAALVASRRAAAAAERAASLANRRYEQGAASYLEVVTAQTAFLQARREVLDLSTRQQRGSVQLIRALGGGWQES